MKLRESAAIGPFRIWLADYVAVHESVYGRYCCKSPRGAARPGKFGNNRIRMAGSVNQNSRFDLGARKLFFVPAPKIVLQQNRPDAEAPTTGMAGPLSEVDLPCRRSEWARLILTRTESCG